MILRGLRLYGLIACLGVVITVAIRPDLLGSPLSAWWPDVDWDVLGVFCILLSCVAWTGLKFLDRPHRRRDDG
jgi:hypothetical protein